MRDVAAIGRLVWRQSARTPRRLAEQKPKRHRDISFLPPPRTCLSGLYGTSRFRLREGFAKLGGILQLIKSLQRRARMRVSPVATQRVTVHQSPRPVSTGNRTGLGINQSNWGNLSLVGCHHQPEPGLSDFFEADKLQPPSHPLRTSSVRFSRTPARAHLRGER